MLADTGAGRPVTATAQAEPDSSGSADSGAWHAIEPANPNAPNGTSNAVSCPSASDCEAVGSAYDASGALVTLAEAWDGTSWKIQHTPDLVPEGSAWSELLSVSCTAADACEAVGASGTSVLQPAALAEVWNGTSWTVQATPDPAGSTETELTSVSCSAARSCEAVGFASDAGVPVPLAAVWDGDAWTIQRTPNPAASGGTQLVGVSCAAADVCEAVGWFETRAAASSAPDGTKTLAEAWNGTSWSRQPTPDVPGLPYAELNAVACPAADACEAVGSYGSDAFSQLTLAEAWNGTAWTRQHTPTPGGAEELVLNGVSCTAVGSCEAVGSYCAASVLDSCGWLSGCSCNAGGEVTLADSWNGTAWTRQHTPNPSQSVHSGINAVACSGADFCEAVGSSNAKTLAEAWTGTSWMIHHTPDPVGSEGNALAAVSCTASDACMAVGYATYVGYLGGENVDGGPLAEMWNGSSWSIEPAPSPPGSTWSQLTAVSCLPNLDHSSSIGLTAP